MKSAQQVYAYTVCLLTLICGMVTAGLFAFNALRVVAPSLTLGAYERQRCSSNAEFRQSYQIADPKVRDDEAAVTKLRLEHYRSVLELEPREGLQGIAFEGIILLIDILVFAIHWRMRVSPALDYRWR